MQSLRSTSAMIASMILLSSYSPTSAQDPGCELHQVCPQPSPTVTPIPSPSPIKGKRISKKNGIRANQMEAKYLSVGSKWALKPNSEIMENPYNVFTFSLLPGAQTSPPYPNTWSPLTVQGVYRDDLWEDQAIDFAGRDMLLCGTVSESIINVESGKDKTRLQDGSIDVNASKYAVGLIAHGSVARGGSAWDAINALGSASYASTNFYDVQDSENPGHDPNENRRIHSMGLVGSDNFAYLGRRISADLKDADGPIDGRQHVMKSDDKADITPAIVDYILGMSGGVLFDNKRTDFCTEGGHSGGKTQAGYIDNAWAIRATAGANVEGSWINVGEANCMTAMLYIGDTLKTSEDHFCNNCEREGSHIRSWSGINIHPPYIGKTCAPIQIDSYNAIVTYDQDPKASGGSPLQVLATVSSGEESVIVEPEKGASLIVRSDVVVGDGKSETGSNGFDTDVLRVNDVINLRPRTSPPTFSSNTAPSDRVGLLYFDAVRNCLRVSIAAPTSDDESWQSSNIAWVDLAMDQKNVDPEKDFSAGRERDRSKDKKISEQSTLKEKAKKAGELAKSGQSKYITPEIDLVVGQLRTDNGETADFPVTFLLEGFHGKTPRLFYRFLGHGPKREGKRGWSEIEQEALEAPEGLDGISDVLTATLDATVPHSPLRYAQPGQIIQFLAIHPETGQSIGSSAKLQ